MTTRDLYDTPPSQVVLDLVLKWSNAMPRPGHATVIDGSMTFCSRNHRGSPVMLTTPVFFDGEPWRESPPRFVFRRLGPHVWKLSPSVLDEQIHAYITLVDVPEPPPWEAK